ncbi:hypothetical protein IWW36_001706 [Coemansia brasiliensis]|uniref:Uncharacterized protein n=1 Tax=Coemansia brasiliensis TaxID=2650707 RepID=A0A9W8I971_9FUNG|nr:hypothetical protein IWW36_001706 [Coemansia brasiliensis]
MYQQGPPPRADSGGMPPAGFSSQYPQYPSGSGPQAGYNTQSNLQPPPPAHQSTMGPSNTYPGPRYSPPPPPSMSRPMSQYNPENGPSRPSRMSSHPPSHLGRQNEFSKTHYGDLVTESPSGTTACSGDAWGACCKYNTLACLLCCNGCLRLCGGGMSLMEVLHLS